MSGICLSVQVSGVVATVFGSTGFLARYIINALARQGTQVVVPYRADDIDAQHLRQMGDLGQVRDLCCQPLACTDYCTTSHGTTLHRELQHHLETSSRINTIVMQFPRCCAQLQVYAWKDFDVRNDEHIRDALKRSNVVINLIAKDKETWNFDFEEVNVDIPRRIAKIAAESPLLERFMHFSCIGASKDSASRRLRTKVRSHDIPETGGTFPVYLCQSSVTTNISAT